MYMLVDTAKGLKVIKCTQSAFFSEQYAVQMVGSQEDCLREKMRLKALDR